MAVVTVNSAEITAKAAAGIAGVFASADKSVLRVANVNIASAAGDITSTLNLCTFPAGKYRLNLASSWLSNNAWGSSVALTFGLSAYTNQSGTAVTAVTDGIKASTSIASAGSFSLLTNGSAAYVDVYSSTDFTVTATVGGAAMTTGKTLSGFIAYMSL